MFLTILLAVGVPFAFLYAIHWLDMYGSDRPRIVAMCVAWGLVAFLLSFAVAIPSMLILPFALRLPQLQDPVRSA